MNYPRSNLYGQSQVLKGDLTSHGGYVMSGSATNHWYGIPVARQGDDVFCPRCAPHFFKISNGLKQADDRGLPLAAEGHVASCGAVLIARTAPASVIAAARYLSNAGQNSHDEQIQAVGDSNQPLAGVAYFIEGEDGAVLNGYTDAEGKCPRLFTEGQKQLKYWFGFAAIQKMNEVLK